MKKEIKIKSVPPLDLIIPVEPQNGANKKRACKTDHPYGCSLRFAGPVLIS